MLNLGLAVSVFLVVILACSSPAPTPTPTLRPAATPTPVSRTTTPAPLASPTATPLETTRQLPGTPVPLMQSRLHVNEPQRVQYSTTPPTSGDHWPRWSNCGFFQEELPDGLIVHNLEHGNVVVSYNLSSPADVDMLRQVLSGIGAFSRWGVARTYSKIPQGTVALSAWGVLLTLTGVDAEQIGAFFVAYAGRGGPLRSPESIPCDR